MPSTTITVAKSTTKSQFTVTGSAPDGYPLALMPGKDLNAFDAYWPIYQPGVLLDVYGTVTGTTITGGVAMIEANGIADGSILQGGMEFVASGGLDRNSTVNRGALVVDKGATASGDVVNGAPTTPTMLVTQMTNPDTALRHYLYSLPASYMDVYGSVSGTKVNGGAAIIESGGLATNSVIAGGLQFVASGGADKGSILSKGALVVDKGATASGDVVNGSGSPNFAPRSALLPSILDVWGYASNETVNGAGLVVEKGGVVDSFALNNYGAAEIGTGGTAKGAISVNSSTLVVDSGASVLGSISLNHNSHLSLGRGSWDLGVSLARYDYPDITLLGVSQANLSMANGVLSASFSGGVDTFHLANASNLSVSSSAMPDGLHIYLSNH